MGKHLKSLTSILALSCIGCIAHATASHAAPSKNVTPSTLNLLSYFYKGEPSFIKTTNGKVSVSISKSALPTKTKYTVPQKADLFMEHTGPTGQRVLSKIPDSQLDIPLDNDSKLRIYSTTQSGKSKLTSFGIEDGKIEIIEDKIAKNGDRLTKHYLSSLDTRKPDIKFTRIISNDEKHDTVRAKEIAYNGVTDEYIDGPTSTTYRNTENGDYSTTYDLPSGAKLHTGKLGDKQYRIEEDQDRIKTVYKYDSGITKTEIKDKGYYEQKIEDSKGIVSHVTAKKEANGETSATIAKNGKIRVVQLDATGKIKYDKTETLKDLIRSQYDK